MLKPIKNVPLDYSLCQMTVTVYHREGLTCQVLEGVHYEFTDQRTVKGGIVEKTRHFQLVIPGDRPIHPGDKVVLGVGPLTARWQNLTVENTPTLGLVTSVQPRYYQGKVCHIEAKG